VRFALLSSSKIAAELFIPWLTAIRRLNGKISAMEKKEAAVFKSMFKGIA
jgi:hypothetical protein